MTRRRSSMVSAHDRAVRDLGGIRVAQRAEQLRALGMEYGRVADLLAVEPDALRRYYEFQDDMSGAA